MPDDSTEPTAPDAINPDDGPILTTLAVRYHKIWTRRKIDQDMKAELEARIAADTTDIEKVRKAAIALGATPSKKGWFEPIRNAVGHEVFDRAMKDAGLFLYWGEDTDFQDITIKTDIHEEVVPLPATASIRELVVERLEKSGQAGTRASLIRESIEALRDTTLHDKTIGMTLYRLSQDGLARREGRTWFFVPEAKNPGAEDAGATNRDDKKGEEP